MKSETVCPKVLQCKVVATTNTTSASDHHLVSPTDCTHVTTSAPYIAFYICLLVSCSY